MRRRDFFLARRHLADTQDDRIGPFGDAIVVLRGNAEDVGDHIRRQMDREVASEIAFAALDEVVDQVVGESERSTRSSWRSCAG